VRAQFQTTLLNLDGITKAKNIAEQFDRFLDELELICGDGGREMALVRTNLETACFFAKKAMALKPENQQ
jgi:hypothetical protein